MTAPASKPRSLRLRLVLALVAASCLLWGSVGWWRLQRLEHELNAMLDERLVASAHMVASIAQQLQPHGRDGLPVPAGLEPTLQTVIGRDGVACEVSLVRSEVDMLPIARTAGAPEHASLAATGFGQATKGGKLWRTYVLQEGGLRVATADRLDLRAQMARETWIALAWPFALALAGVALLSWWITTHGLRPLQRLRRELQQQPTGSTDALTAGSDTQELGPVVDALNQLLARTHALMEHERRWSADAAHELRTPLTAIKTHVQVAQLALARGGQDGTCHQALEQTQQGIAQMQHMMEQLLELARLEAEGTPERGRGLTCGAVLLQTLEQAVAQSRAHAGQACAEVALHCRPQADDAAWEAACVALPAPLLAAALTNVLNNALYHHHGDAPVTVALQLAAPTTQTPFGQFAITVRDQGPGMSQQDCERALQRFWRKSGQSPGSGLGLTITDRIMHSGGGSLQLAPAQPGLQVQLRLPLVAPIEGH